MGSSLGPDDVDAAAFAAASAVVAGCIACAIAESLRAAVLRLQRLPNALCLIQTSVPAYLG